jgi:hypothetical protein
MPALDHFLDYRFLQFRQPFPACFPLLTNPNVPLPQFAPDPRPSVGASGFGVDRLDVGQQCHAAYAPRAFVRHFPSMQVQAFDSRKRPDQTMAVAAVRSTVVEAPAKHQRN